LTGLAVAPVPARITRVVVEQRERAYDGKPFGSAGSFEKLTGHIYGELDPKDPLNAVITDLQFAPRNDRGMVDYSSTFTVTKPVDVTKGSGVLFYLVSNRGNIPLPGGLDITELLKRGHVVMASGWQGDVTPRGGAQTITVPVATKPDGSSITGPVLMRFYDMPPNTTTMLTARGLGARTLQPLPASLDTSKALLTRRLSEGHEIVPISSRDWAFADCTKSAFPGIPDPERVCVKGGFNPAFLYELTYTAKDPPVLGIGFAAVRDLNSFFRYSAADDAGSPNMLARSIKFVIGQGNSQSATFLRSFIHLGFNQDEAGRMVFDGINAFTGVRQVALNYRFAAPSSVAELYEPGSDGVVWWESYADEARHRPPAGLLDRCRSTETCPKIMETFGSSEFWNLRASPDFVGTRADWDIPLPQNVRRYYFAGVTHGGGRGGFDPATPAPPPRSLQVATRCELPANPNPTVDTMRALMIALEDWVTKGAPPPPSQYPRLDRGELVVPTAEAMGFPIIPGQPMPDAILNPLYDYDFGPRFNYDDLSGEIAVQPPPIRGILPSLVPRVNADGNEIGGIASALLQVPLGTYLGWNVIATGFFKGHGCGLNGGYIPFAKTKAERVATGDPRLSLEERYGTHDRYVTAVRAATKRLVQQRLLLAEDADRLVREADASAVLR
jgi:hypothetical protein